MHVFFEQDSRNQCDSPILSFSWMYMESDQAPSRTHSERDLSRFNKKEGWLALGAMNGLVAVTYTTGIIEQSVSPPARTNFNLRGHVAQVVMVKWNEPYQKLATCDGIGLIYVWMRFEGRWSIELINDRGVSVTHFSWSHNGRMALISYMDGFILIGSATGQRHWSNMLDTDCQVISGAWAPDDQMIYLGTSNGQIIVMNVTGDLLARVQLFNEMPLISMLWSCPKFITNNNAFLSDKRRYVLAVCFINGMVLLMKEVDDEDPIIIRTGLAALQMEWANKRQILCVAGGLRKRKTTNILKMYNKQGKILHTSTIPISNQPVTAITWAHDDEKIFIATGSEILIGWMDYKFPSLQRLSSIQLFRALNGNRENYNQLRPPCGVNHVIGKYFFPTLWCNVPKKDQLIKFICESPSSRLYCTVKHRKDILTGTSYYYLLLEHLGGVIPLLKGKRSGKFKHRFVIYDPQESNLEDVGSDDDTEDEEEMVKNVVETHDSDSSYSEGEGEGDSALHQRSSMLHYYNPIHDYQFYFNPAPNTSKLAVVSSNLWGTKYKIKGYGGGLPKQLGEICFKTSVLHLQPRQMTISLVNLCKTEGGRKPSSTSNSTLNTMEELLSKPEKSLDRPLVIAPASKRKFTCRICDADNSGFITPPTEIPRTEEGDITCRCGLQVSVRKKSARSKSVGYLDLVDYVGKNNDDPSLSEILQPTRSNPPSLATIGKSRSLDSSGIKLFLLNSIPPPVANTKGDIMISRSTPGSPARSKLKDLLSSPFKKRLLNSPLTLRKNRQSNNCNRATTRNTDFTNLETFQKQQIKNKIEAHSSKKSTNSDELLVLHNKTPIWNEENHVYQLDFGGRVTLESAKNFQVEHNGEQVMQFGRIDLRTYTLDFQQPFTAVQAFSVALASITQRLK